VAEEPLPAWSLAADAVDRIAVPAQWPERVTRDWALGDATGAGVRVCIVDSGIEPDHPLVGPIDQAVAVRVEGDDAVVVDDGLRWAVERQFDVINMSLSTTKRQFANVLHDLADNAYFRRTMLVASAHNLPVESYPWRFSSVLSVGSHELDDPLAWFYNPSPPVEFFARGVNVDVAWLGGGTLRVTGNSFATPHMSGICALVRSKHPELTAFALKNVLYLTSSNVAS
jgi:subtilisin family serine protease